MQRHHAAGAHWLRFHITVTRGPTGAGIAPGLLRRFRGTDDGVKGMLAALVGFGDP